ncbi:hypothetical protein [Acetobacterium bakii]|uniref:hypothetical protein n=1 Tax=Acetobacterium bakii TaxID=52689 RepID=UPI000F8D4A77|nr:hypothetical protein [Acetobacterium bakii]
MLGLVLKTDYKPDMGEIQEIEQQRQLKQAFDDWCDKTYSDYAKIARFYWHNLKEYRPVNEGDAFHLLYVDAVHRLETVNYILDILLKGTQEEKTALYKDLNRLEVKAG